jgi:hypothetical protein
MQNSISLALFVLSVANFASSIGHVSTLLHASPALSDTLLLLLTFKYRSHCIATVY